MGRRKMPEGLPGPDEDSGLGPRDSLGEMGPRGQGCPLLLSPPVIRPCQTRPPWLLPSTPPAMNHRNPALTWRADQPACLGPGAPALPGEASSCTGPTASSLLHPGNGMFLKLFTLQLLLLFKPTLKIAWSGASGSPFPRLEVVGSVPSAGAQPESTSPFYVTCVSMLIF